MHMWLFVIAILLLVLIPFMPALLRLRIRILRWLKWNWAANLLENHFQGWLVLFRILLFVVATLLFYICWTQ
jgi:hypothetical protein